MSVRTVYQTNKRIWDWISYGTYKSNDGHVVTADDLWGHKDAGTERDIGEIFDEIVANRTRTTQIGPNDPLPWDGVFQLPTGAEQTLPTYTDTLKEQRRKEGRCEECGELLPMSIHGLLECPHKKNGVHV